MRAWPTRSVIGISLLFLGACSSGVDEPGPGDRTGEQVYRGTITGGNTFTCETCHALFEPAADGFRRPGHSIGDAARRPSFKNGRHQSLLAAVNTCVTEWMVAPAWTESSAEWIALEAFLKAQAGEAAAPALTIQIVNPPSELDGGDALAGRTLFNSSCAICHGQEGAGTRKAPSIVGFALPPDYIAQRVRTSGGLDSPTYDGLSGGRMPFWGADRLSDAELLDLIAYVSTAPRADAGVSGGDAGVRDDDAGPSGCGSTHAKVGQTATFTTRFHGVSGMAEIVDDCTIRLTNFNYDGQGIDVRVYAGLGGNYRSGFAISDDLIRGGGYNSATLTLRLPSGRTLDQLDGISIWCVDVAIDFGDARF